MSSRSWADDDQVEVADRTSRDSSRANSEARLSHRHR